MRLEARLTAIEDEWEVRFDALIEEYVALKTTMGSELEARMTELAAIGCELEVLRAEVENLPTDPPESIDVSHWIDLFARLDQLNIRRDDDKAKWEVQWSARLDELKTLRDAKHDQMEAYEAAINSELEVWYSAWESAYNEKLRTTPTTVMAEICSVCTENFVHVEGIGFQLSCNHQFHQLCLKPWIKDNYTCPLCRQIPSSG